MQIFFSRPHAWRKIPVLLHSWDKIWKWPTWDILRYLLWHIIRYIASYVINKQLAKICLSHWVRKIINQSSQNQRIWVCGIVDDCCCDWSYFLPLTAVDCGHTLKAPSNGFVNVPCTTLDCTTSYSCKSGYELVGQRSRTCQPDGTWSHQTPTCQRKHW